MTSDTHIAMHHEHRAWQEEAGQWRDDLRVWQQEIVAAQGDLRDVEKALNAHFDDMRRHASAVRLHEMDTDEHEHALVLYERGGIGEDLLIRAKEHARESTRHTQLTHDHELMRNKQRKVMSAAIHFIKAVHELSEVKEE
jgi:hypothetical protein